MSRAGHRCKLCTSLYYIYLEIKTPVSCGVTPWFSPSCARDSLFVMILATPDTLRQALTFETPPCGRSPHSSCARDSLFVMIPAAPDTLRQALTSKTPSCTLYASFFDNAVLSFLAHLPIFTFPVPTAIIRVYASCPIFCFLGQMGHIYPVITLVWLYNTLYFPCKAFLVLSKSRYLYQKPAIIPFRLV